MILGSLQARIWKTNKNLRIRKATPRVGLHGPMTPMGLYQRLEYMGFALSNSDVWYRSIPTKYRKTTNLITRKDIVETVAYKQRGRWEFAGLMRSKKLIGRAGLQLLRL